MTITDAKKILGEKSVFMKDETTNKHLGIDIKLIAENSSNQEDGDGCSNACSIEQGWQCSGYPSTCTSICGDGFIRDGEQCDDNNQIAPITGAIIGSVKRNEIFFDIFIAIILISVIIVYIEKSKLIKNIK